MHARINFITSIMRKHTTYFVKLTITHCFNSAFLFFNLIHMKEIPFLFMLGEDLCKRTVSQFHNFWNFLQRFTNFKNSQKLLVNILRKIILNFLLDCSKRQENPLFNRRCVLFLTFKRLVNKNFDQMIFLFREIM